MNTHFLPFTIPEMFMSVEMVGRLYIIQPMTTIILYPREYGQIQSIVTKQIASQ